jgi:hypothetical protein
MGRPQELESAPYFRFECNLSRARIVRKDSEDAALAQPRDGMSEVELYKILA